MLPVALNSSKAPRLRPLSRFDPIVAFDAISGNWINVPEERSGAVVFFFFSAAKRFFFLFKGVLMCFVFNVYKLLFGVIWSYCFCGIFFLWGQTMGSKPAREYFFVHILGPKKNLGKRYSG